MNVKRRKEILRTRVASEKAEVKVEEVKVEVPAAPIVEEPKKKFQPKKAVVEEKPEEEKVVEPVKE